MSVLLNATITWTESDVVSRKIVKSRYGKIIVDTNDRYLGRSMIEYGEFSEGEAELFKKLIMPDMIVCDIGANFGAHTILFSQLAKWVYAIEPQRYVFDTLQETIELNELKNVTAIRAAIGDGTQVKYRELDTSIPNNFGSFSFVDAVQGKTMQTYTLDSLPCHFLKIDVEGMELEVLKGATQMIKEYQPMIYVENDRSDRADTLIEYLNGLGYDCMWHTPKLFNPDNFFGKTEDIFPDVISINMLCAPKGLLVSEMPLAKVGDWPKYFHSSNI